MQTPESMPAEPRARLLLGACRFTGIFECPCREGSAFESLKDLRPDTSCEKCGHSLMLHNEHEGFTPIIAGPQPRIKTELPNNIQGPCSAPANTSTEDTIVLPVDDATELQAQLCQRENTVLKIAKMLADGESILIWGMKGTGKTILANLLFEFLSSKTSRVILIQSWLGASKKKVDDILIEHARTQFPDWTDDDLVTKDLIFIIDEAQEALKTAKSRSAWNTLMKASESSETRPRFCIFSNQGILPELHSVFASMPEISHLKTHGNGDGHLSLFFTMAEFEEFFQQNHAFYGFELEQEAAEHIYSLTAGHPAILRLILRYIKLHVNQANAGSYATVSRPDIMAIMHNEDRLFNYLGGNVYPERYARDNKAVVRVFKKLLESPEGKIGWDSASKPTIEKCFLYGLLSHEIDVNDPDNDIFRFPSPLHARWAQWYHKVETSVYAGELSP